MYRKSKAVIRNGKRQTVKAGFYRVGYEDASGEQRDRVLVLPNGQRVADKSVAEAELTRILRQVEREPAGLVDPMVHAGSMPIRVILARYVRHLRRKRRSPKYVKQQLSCSKWIIEQAGIERLAALDEANVDQALGMLSNADLSSRTINDYRGVAHALGGWAVKVARVLDRNPVAMIERRDQKSDIRKSRRALSIDEAYRLLSVCGPRRLWYATALWIGLRLDEQRRLEWKDLALDGDRPAIRLRAGTTKAKRADELPLHRDLADMLCEARPPLHSQPIGSLTQRQRYERSKVG